MRARRGQKTGGTASRRGVEGAGAASRRGAKNAKTASRRVAEHAANGIESCSNRVPTKPRLPPHDLGVFAETLTPPRRSHPPESAPANPNKGFPAPSATLREQAGRDGAATTNHAEAQRTQRQHHAESRSPQGTALNPVATEYARSRFRRHGRRMILFSPPGTLTPSRRSHPPESVPTNPNTGFPAPSATLRDQLSLRLCVINCPRDSA